MYITMYYMKYEYALCDASKKTKAYLLKDSGNE